MRKHWHIYIVGKAEPHLHGSLTHGAISGSPTKIAQIKGNLPQTLGKGWGDGSVSKVLTTQVQGPEFETFEEGPCEAVGHGGSLLQCLGK